MSSEQLFDQNPNHSKPQLEIVDPLAIDEVSHPPSELGSPELGYARADVAAAIHVPEESVRPEHLGIAGMAIVSRRLLRLRQGKPLIDPLEDELKQVA